MHGAGVGSPAPLTLDAAMALGQARIREVPGGRHTIDNLSDRAIFIQAGDMVRGGSQDQVAISSMLVPPGVSNFAIGLFCVERDRFAPLAGTRTDEFSAAGLIPSQAAKLSLLTRAKTSPTSDLLRRVGVWFSVESVANSLSQRIGTPVRSAISPSSLPQALEGDAVLGAYQPYVASLLTSPPARMISLLMSLEGEAVRASRSVFAAALFFAGTNTSDAASRLSPKEIQAEFCNGQPFTSSTPSNTKFTMVFKADGKVTRNPQGKTGVGGEGTWKLSKDGFCTTWKGSKENCFTLVTAGEKKWSVMKGKASVGTWSK